MFVDPPFPEYHRKRLREDEEEASSGSPVGFTEHRSVSFRKAATITSSRQRAAVTTTTV
jgi:hypothetical protein